MLLQDEWEEKYKPTENPDNYWGIGYSPYEVYSPQLDFVQSQPHNLVWTEVEAENGSFIVAGLRLENPIQFYICEVPWQIEGEAVVISITTDCSICSGSGAGDSDDEACWNCNGGGYVSPTPQNREELIELVGDKQAASPVILE